METMSRDLFISLLESLEHDMEIELGLADDVFGREKQVIDMKDAFYKKYYRYIGDFQKLQETFAKQHYT